MQQYELPFSHWVLSAVLAAAGGAAWAQGAEVPAAPVPLIAEGESLPPRFVLCQREVGAQAGDRKALMRSCLARRLEGESVVQRDCKRQVGSVKGVQARQSALLACERQALAVASTELPRGAPPAPRPAPSVTAEARRPAANPSPVVPVGANGRMPAAGEN